MPELHYSKIDDQWRAEWRNIRGSSGLLEQNYEKRTKL